MNRATMHADPARRCIAAGPSSCRACAARRTRASTCSRPCWSLGYLFLRRNTEVEGTDLLAAAGGAAEHPRRADRLRGGDRTGVRPGDGEGGRHPAAAKAVPHGLRGYVTGQLLFHSLGLLPSLVVILVPSFLLFDGLMADRRLVDGRWVLVLGLLAAMPIGMVIGSLVPSAQKVGTWGMLPVMVLAGISGIFYPIQQLWGWVQVVAQVFPMYWLGLGMRSAFLPDRPLRWRSPAPGGRWRRSLSSAPGRSSGVLTPVVLRRMARRQSGSQVEAAREAHPVGPLTAADGSDEQAGRPEQPLGLGVVLVLGRRLRPDVLLVRMSSAGSAAGAWRTCSARGASRCSDIATSRTGLRVYVATGVRPPHRRRRTGVSRRRRCRRSPGCG